MRRILVVEDEELILWSLEKGLSRGGFEVAGASTCAIARDQHAKFNPDAVLLDLRLPDG